jgi:hypothetical protein
MALRGTAGSAATSASTSIVVTVGGIGIQSGDIVLIFCNFNTFPNTISSTGFSILVANQNIGTANSAVTVLSKTAGGSEPSTYTINGTASDLYSVQCRVYSGRSGTVTAQQTTNLCGTGAPPVTTSITGLTAAAGDDVILFIGGSTSTLICTYSWTQPSGYLNSLVTSSSVTTSFAPNCYSADNTNISAGGTGTLVTTQTNTGPNNIGYAAFLVSLAAAAGNTASIAWVT